MTFRYQEFIAPGTWTWPGTVTEVRVTVVGGGGGASGGIPGISTFAGGGGGGAVRTQWLPVTGPVPITIGSGGTGSGTYPATTGGGTSAFGPLGPGPVPTIPPTTLAAGGGARAYDSIPGPLAPISGGAGQNWSTTFSEKQGGAFGQPTNRGGPAGSGGLGAFRYIGVGPSAGYGVSWGEDYYGTGGTNSIGTPDASCSAVYGIPFPSSPTPVGAPAPVCANTGAGGGVTSPSTGANGSGGIVIVRWFE